MPTPAPMLAAHPLHPVVRRLARGVIVDPQARIGAALRTPEAVVAVQVVAVEAGSLRLVAALPEVPQGRCVLTVMIGDVLRIDLPVRLATAEHGDELEATLDGVPLVLRRRVAVTGQLARALGAAA